MTIDKVAGASKQSQENSERISLADIIIDVKEEVEQACTGRYLSYTDPPEKEQKAEDVAAAEVAEEHDGNER